MKYLHLLIENFYSRKFFDVIRNNFNFQEHFFVVIRIQNEKSYFNGLTYQNLKIYTFPNNIIKRILIKKKGIRLLISNSDYIFIHYLSDDISRILLRIKKRAIISWIIWGADLYNYIPIKIYDPRTEKMILNLKSKKILNKSFLTRLISKVYLWIFKKIRKKVIKKFDYIITPYKGDYQYLNHYYKTNAKWYSKAIYPNPIDFEEMDKEVDLIDEKFNFKDNESKLLLLGNSGAPTNNYLDILTRLSKLKEQKFKIICPLSYGPPIYIKEIIENGKKLFGDRFIPLLEFFNPKIYYHILKQIDLAIMYHNRQQGMGTIHILLYLGKPICMKKTTGFFHLRELDASIFSIESLDRLILDKLEFSEAMAKNNKKVVLQNFSIKSTISSIKSLLKYLEDIEAGKYVSEDIIDKNIRKKYVKLKFKPNK